MPSTPTRRNSGAGQQLFEADLAKSRIPLKYVKRLQLKLLTATETAAWIGEKIYAVTYEIPYFTSRGKPTGFSRLKILQIDEKKTTAKFGETEESGKKKQAPRYLQKPNTRPHLYIPPLYKWQRNAADRIKIPRLVITEGEKKAAKACLVGVPCVALGGVDSYQSKKLDMSLLDEFDEFDLSETEVEICFDSDFNLKESVRRAMNGFAAELTNQQRSASISYVVLDGESTSNGKQGLDDFLALYETDKEALAAFDKLPRRAYSLKGMFDELDKELCFVNATGRFYNIPHDRYYDSGAAILLEYGAKYKVTDPQDPRNKVPAAKLWIDNRGAHTTIQALAYEPGRPRRYRDKEELEYINLWRPSKIKPIKGRCDPWLDLVRFIMGTAESYNWFMQWLAYPLQHPGTKILQAVFVYSIAQGIGKNFVIEPLVKAIYGNSYQVIGADALEDKYNEWAARKQFIFAEEVYMSDRRDREATMGNLKKFITNDSITINAKYRRLETFSNYAQLYMTANQPNALALDSADRRIMVVHAPEQPREDSYYKKLNEWCLREDSPGNVLYHLLNEIDVSAFNPKAAAPTSTDKQEVILSGRGVLEYYIGLVDEEPELLFSKGGIRSDQDIFSAREILAAVANYAEKKGSRMPFATETSLGRWLMHTKHTQRRRLVFRGGEGKLRGGSYYCVFNTKKWRAASDREWGKHYRLHSANAQDEQLIEGPVPDESKDGKRVLKLLEGGKK